MIQLKIVKKILLLTFISCLFIHDCHLIERQKDDEYTIDFSKMKKNDIQNINIFDILEYKELYLENVNPKKFGVFKDKLLDIIQNSSSKIKKITYSYDEKNNVFPYTFDRSMSFIATEGKIIVTKIGTKSWSDEIAPTSANNNRDKAKTYQSILFYKKLNKEQERKERREEERESYGNLTYDYLKGYGGYFSD